MKKLLLATRNPGKQLELSAFLVSFKVASLADVGIDDEVEEDGKTFEDNSQKKALFYARLSGLPTISDDGGLEIDALNGEPGVRSRRWLGYEGTDQELREHLRKVVASLPYDRRSARFVTVVSLALPDGQIWSERGEIAGVLKEPESRDHMEGYPFRSFFYLPEIKKFYHESELNPSEMKVYNHRYKAIRKLFPLIKKHT